MIEIDRLAVDLEAEAGIVRAVDDLALTLARGETFALVGESGCGKSMTALALMGQGGLLLNRPQVDDRLDQSAT